MTTTAPDAAAPKTEWRRWASGLPPVDPALAATISDHVAAFLATIDGPVLSYVALRDEVRLARLGQPVTTRSPVALPRMIDDGSMAIHLDDGGRERHRIGIEQPPAHTEAIDPAALAAVLVPGRVFDRDGYRIGRGGGHYDRLVPQLRPHVPVIGVTVSSRIVDRVPREPHDAPMTHLATEHGVFSTN